MAHHQHSQARAEAEKDEPVLDCGMIGVGDQKSMLVEKDGLRFLKGNAVLPLVQTGLRLVPFEPKSWHAASVGTLYLQVKE